MKIPSPEDDPNWPICGNALACPNFTPLPRVVPAQRGWCEHVREVFFAAQDARGITFGSRIVVPVYPEAGLYAEVSIDSETIADTLANLALVREEDPFSMEEELIPLGLYTRGEGRLVIASTINDWIASQEVPMCTAASHGYEEEMRLQTFERRAPDASHASFWRAHNWCIVYFKMCWPCFQSQNGVTPTSPDNFGLTGVTAPRMPPNPSRPNNRNRAAGGSNIISTSGTPAPGRPNSTRDLLQQRGRQREGRTI